MPKPDISTNTMRYAFEGESGAIFWALVAYLVWQGTEDFTLADASTLAESVAEAWTDTGRLLDTASISDDTKVHRMKFKMYDFSLNLFRGSIPLEYDGSGGSGTEAGQVCYLINANTADPRKGGKSRWYLPGVRTADLADTANLSTSALTAKSAQAAATITALKAITHSLISNPQPVEMSFVNDKAFRVTPIAYEIYTASCNPVVGTQRRRVDRLRPS